MKHLITYTSLLLCILFSGRLVAQGPAPSAYEGTEFVFGFMDNSIEGSLPNYWIQISVPPSPLADMVEVTLQIPGLIFADSILLPRGGNFVYVLPTSFIDPITGKPGGLPVDSAGIDRLFGQFSTGDSMLLPKPGKIQRNGFRITSPLTHFGFNY